MGVLKLKMYQVDAFASAVFGGNPAAVCILEDWITDETMQRIAEENNLAETAYAVYNNGVYDIRWFTPEEEVDLCGHATLATSYVLFNHETKHLSEATKNSALQLHSHRSGPLSVVKKGDDLYELNFPVDDLKQSDFNLSHTEVLVGCKAINAFEGKTDSIGEIIDLLKGYSYNQFWVPNDYFINKIIKSKNYFLVMIRYFFRLMSFAYKTKLIKLNKNEIINPKKDYNLVVALNQDSNFKLK